MPLTINTNVASLSAQRHLASNTFALQKSMEKLSSGHRINRAADDAAGLALSENLRAQIRGSQKALDNVQDAINFLNVADGAIGQMQEAAQRIRELWVQAVNDTYNTPQRDAIKEEVTQLFHFIDQVASSTNYNGIYMLSDGNPGNGQDFATAYPGPIGFRIQVTANADDFVTLPSSQWYNSIDLNEAGVVLGDLDLNNLGMPSWNDDTVPGPPTYNFPWMANPAEVDAFWDFLDGNPAKSIAGIMNILSNHRGSIGATMNRLESTASNLQLQIENLSASESRLRDTDIAAESARLTQQQILQQAASAVLAQANQAPALALQLLKN